MSEKDYPTMITEPDRLRHITEGEKLRELNTVTYEMISGPNQKQELTQNEK